MDSATRDPIDAQNQRFRDIVDRIVQRVNLQEGHEGTPRRSVTGPSAGRASGSEGPLTSAEMIDLSFLCSLASTLPESSETRPTGFASVELDQLTAMTEMLERHINVAAGINLIQQTLEVVENEDADVAVAKWMKHEANGHVNTIRMGLEAASIVVFMAVSQGIDRRVANEDAIESSISLMRSHLQKNLIPAICQIGVGCSSKSLGEKAENGSTPAAKRRKIEAPRLAVYFRSVTKLILPTISAHVVLVERLEKLVSCIPLDDQQILMLTHSAMLALEIDCPAPSPYSQVVSPGVSLQKAFIRLVTEAFRRYKLHRETILEDLFPVMLRLPSGRKSLRALQLEYLRVPSPASLASFNAAMLKGLIPNASEPHCIQMMTGMILSIFQACVTRPYYSDTDMANEGRNSNCSSGLEECKMIIDFFCSHLLERCSKKRSVMEFRPVIVNFVEDLLLCLLLPEYPVAELVLSRLLSLLTIELNRSRSSSSSKQVFETTYLNTVFELFGKISSVQARILAIYRIKGLHLTTPESIAAETQDELVMGCYCGNPSTEGRLAIECDSCRVSYHGNCVDVDVNELEEEWFCDGCKLGRLRQRESQREDIKDESSWLDEDYALYQSFFSTISHREVAAVRDHCDATRMHLARWIAFLHARDRKDNGNTIKMKPVRITQHLLDFWERPGPGAEPLTDEGTSRLVFSLCVKTSPLLKCFHPQMSVILKIMADGSHNLRKLSLKTIEKTAEGDSSLMTMKYIAEVVSRRFTDESISVRDAAISLVGAYITSLPTVADSYHQALLSCLTDSGVSVRKRAVKILEEVLMSRATYKGRSEACNLLLQRAADPKEEDSVRDSVHDLFTRLWLQPSNDIETTVNKKRQRGLLNLVQSPGTSDPAYPSNLVTPTPTSVNSGRYLIHKKRSDVTAEQMVRVVLAGGTNIHLEALLKKLVNEYQAQRSVQTKFGRMDSKYFDEVAGSLFELLIATEEKRSARSSRVAKDIAAIFQTIATFTDHCPEAVLQRIHVLLPFLKADNGVCFEDEAAIVTALCDIIFRLVNRLSGRAAVRLATVKISTDLRAIICRFPPDTIEAAIRAWSSIIDKDENNASDFAKKFLGIFQSFYRHLVAMDSKHEDFSAAEKHIGDSVHRSLAVIGFICKHHGRYFAPIDWDSELENVRTDFALPSAKTVSWVDAPIAAYRIFSRYLMKTDALTRCKALAGYSGMFMTTPRLLLKLEQMKLIDVLISKNAPIELQRETLICLQDLLLAEEKRLEDCGKKSDVEHSVSERIAGDQDGDATILGGILSNHADRLCEMTLALDTKLRDISLQLLEVLLRQGLINPNDAVPFLFALQGDIAHQPIRSRALRLLMREAEKRPDMIRQRVCAGVKKAFSFQRLISPSVSIVSAVVEKQEGENTTYECIFDSIYKECVRPNRKQRIGMYLNLLGQFQFFNDADAIIDHKQPAQHRILCIHADIGLLAFSSQILAHLPYTSLEDPLFIIHNIGAIVAFQGHLILDRLALVLQRVGLASHDDLDESNSSEDALERAAKAKFPKNTKEAGAIRRKEFDMESFIRLCRAGAGLTLLLRLKAYLRTLYGLSEARCLEYDPNLKERLSDKFFCRSQGIPPFDTRIFLENSSKEKDVDSLIRQYAEFRRLMREETVGGPDLPDFGSEEEMNNESTLSNE